MCCLGSGKARKYRMTPELKDRFMNARRCYIEAQFSNLNDAQRQAALQTEGPVLLLAGAGSGKTTVLIHRIANLMQFGKGYCTEEVPEHLTQEDVALLEAACDDEGKRTPELSQLCAWHPVAPWNIIAITFTNKAANELKDRLRGMLGEKADDIWAMTFHSACCRILRRDIERLGYSRSFTIYDTADSERVMKDIIQSMGLDIKNFPPKMFLNLISRAKDQQQNPEEYARSVATSGDFRLEKAAEAYAEYQKRLQDANAVDFDDIILLTVQLLQQFEDIRTYYQRKFRYVLIDEYQDTNHLQYLLAKLLAGGFENICVVGDDDQSIYRFRGATIENILSFEQEYPGASVIRLEQNYRSTQAILNCANAVISHNEGRKGKSLWTQNDPGEPIRVYEAYNEQDEANYVASTIFRVGNGHDFKNFAVLYRTNAQSNALEYAFKRNGVPYRIIGGTRFFDHTEVKDMLAYLSVINNRNDNLRLRRIINTPARGIGAKTVEMAERLAVASGLPLYAVISNPGNYAPLEKAAHKLLAFCAMIEDCADLLKTMSLPEFYEEVMIRSGYVKALMSKNTMENRARLENIHELKSSIISYVENTEEPTLNGFLEEIALYTDIEQYDAEADAVVMMTMHTAKGLEFPYVFIVGAEEGLFPGMRAMGDVSEMEEERRLCYVAITRAKKLLCISYTKQRMLYGRTSYNRPSRFIKELPEESIQTNINRHKQEQETQERKKPVKKRTLGAFSIPTPALTETRSTASFTQGCTVEHTAFGRGIVLSAVKIGNDTLLEIAFDKVGTKKLLANSAAAHMKTL